MEGDSSMHRSKSGSGKRMLEAGAASPGEAGGSSKAEVETLQSGSAVPPENNEVQANVGVPKPITYVYKRKRIEKRADISVVELQDQLAEHERSSLTKESQTAELLPSGEQKTYTEETDRVIQEEVITHIKDSDRPTHVCDLPDNALVKILSLLPLDEAVQTSVLCKRWGNLWALVPELHLKNSDLSKRMIVLGFIERACALRGETAYHVFSMACTLEGAIRQIKKLIGDIVASGVHDLSLLLDNSGSPYMLPTSLFDCPTLERLNLQSCCYLKMKPSSYLPNLKVLILTGIKFEDNGCMEKLFSCPALVKLELRNCRMEELTAIYVFAPRLQHLVIEMSGTGPSEHIVQIYGVCLKYFQYKGRCTDEYTILGNTSALVEATLKLHPHPDSLTAAANGIKLMLICSNVRELTLTHKFLLEMARRGELPLFCNVMKLTVDRMHNFTVKSLWPVLKRFPRLTSLYFTHACDCNVEDGTDEVPYPMPPCVEMELREVSFKVVQIPLRSKERSLAGVFLKYAMALKEMTIRYSCMDGVETRLRDISKFPVGSDKCQIKFKSEP